jgi:hypothetical protein
MVSSLVLAPLLAATSVWAVTNQGTPCLNACSKWSETLSFCYDSFGLSREY